MAERVALRAAIQLGITTHAANNVAEPARRADGTEYSKTVRDSNGAPRGSALRKVRLLEAKPARVTKGVTKSATLIKIKTTDPATTGERGRKRPARAPCAKKLAIAIANGPKRTAATKEFLAREATKLTLAATEQNELLTFLPNKSTASEEPPASLLDEAPPADKRRKLLNHQRPKRDEARGTLRRDVEGDILALLSDRG